MPRRDDVYRITDARLSPSIDREYRTKRYLISMGIRTLCFIAAVFVFSAFQLVWLALLLLIAAVVLPYISVVMANNATSDPVLDSMPPLIIKDATELPVGHPDRPAP